MDAPTTTPPRHTDPLRAQGARQRRAWSALALSCALGIMAAACGIEHDAAMGAERGSEGDPWANNGGDPNDGGFNNGANNLSAAPDPGPAVRVVRSSQPRQLDPVVSEEAWAQAVEGTWRLGLRLVALPAPREQGQVALAPASLALGVGLAHAGARERTRAQLRALLMPQTLDAELPAALNRLEQTLRLPDQLELRQQLWLDRRVNLLPSYLDTLAEHYGVGVNLADSSSMARQAASLWLERQRETPLAAVDPLHEGAGLIVTAAMTMSLSWAQPMTPLGEGSLEFRAPSGLVLATGLLGQADVFVDDQGALHARLSTSHPQLSVYLHSPARWLGWLERLDRAWIERARGQLEAQGQRRALILPALQIDARSSQRAALGAAGATDALDASRANFAGINGQGGLVMAELGHALQVRLDAQGLSVVADGPSRTPPTEAFEPEPVLVERPFVLLVRHEPTGALVLISAVTSP